MTDHAPDAARTSLLNPESFPSYQIRNRKEIVHLMNSLVDKRALLTAYVDGGPLSFVTAVLAITVDGESVILDASPDETLNDRATAAAALVCAARLDGVRVQFNVGTPERFPHDGYSALRCPLPELAIRLQRREFYRLPVPISNPVRCAITVRQGEADEKTVEVRAVDISAGGIGIAVPVGELDIKVGTELGDCMLMIPDSGSIKVALRVRNQFLTTNRSGLEVLRLGCEFVGIPNKVVTQIQRYIFKVERERKALEANS